MNISPDYLADTLRRLEARRARHAPLPAPQPRAVPLRIVGWYGTISSVDQVDRRRPRADPGLVESVISEIVGDFLGTREPGENEIEDATIGNEELLRGIPTTGVGGTMKHTDPLRVVLGRERRARGRGRIAS